MCFLEPVSSFRTTEVMEKGLGGEVETEYQVTNLFKIIGERFVCRTIDIECRPEGALRPKRGFILFSQQRKMIMERIG